MRALVDTEFAIDVLEVKSDGADGKDQLLGYFRRRVALGQERQNIALPPRQGFEARLGRFVFSSSIRWSVRLRTIGH